MTTQNLKPLFRRAFVVPALLAIGLNLRCGSNDPESRAPDVKEPSAAKPEATDDTWQAPPPFESEPATLRKLTQTAPSYGVDEPEPRVPGPNGAFDWPALHHPLLSLSATGDRADDRELEAALAELSARPDWQGAERLRRFAESRDGSRWAAAVALSLGDLAYQVGRFSQALAWWKLAWDRAKADTSPSGRALANQAIAEYAKMNARVGRRDEIQRVLDEVEGREFHGDAAVKLDSAREGLWTMNHKPGVAYRCGPYALTNVLHALSPESDALIAPFLERVASPPVGFSLDQVSDMAPELGLSMQRVHRKPGSDVIVPAVVHWSVGHFGALIEERDGKYRLVDPTFGNETWLGKADIDAESSGYFLVPEGELPSGFRAVDSPEASQVFGKGHSGSADPDETGPDDQQDGGDDEDCAMATYTFHTMLTSLSVSDTPIRYPVARGPEVAFKITYNQREASQPLTMEFTNFSPNWVSTWVSYLEDNPSSPSASVRVRQRGGGGAVFSGYTAATQTFGLHTQTRSTLRRLDVNRYVREYADGSREFYEHYIGTTGPSRRVFLSRIVDPAGNAVSLGYDTSLPGRLLSVIDAVGLTTTLSYERSGQPYLVTAIEDPFGRRANFTYTDVSGVVRLTSIEDAFGIVSSFTYGTLGMTSLTTPYGTTRFELSPFRIGSAYQLIRYIEATDPEGNRERLEYNTNVSDTGVNSSLNERYPDATRVNAYSGDLDDRNSFYWGKHQMRVAPRDYRAAHLYHWIQPDGGDVAMSILESEKPALEGRIWYNYEGQPAPYIQGRFASPSVVGRVVVEPNGTPLTQASNFGYNALGNTTRVVDPVGRETALVYAANNIDLVEVRQKTGANAWQTIQRATFNPAFPPHQPETTTDGAGKITRYTYNTNGQLLTVTNPRNETISYTYETNPANFGLGKITRVSGDLRDGDLQVAYDSFDRIRTITTSEGLALTYDYDALDRVRRISYPDGSYEQFDYENQSLVAERDREGRWTRHRENALRQRVLTRAPNGSTTQLEWCLCGGLRKLIDGNGNVTEWVRDVQGRVSAKRFADGSEIRFGYDYSGRRTSLLDARGQSTAYRYTLDEKLAAVDYTAAGTTDVGYVYDQYFARVASRTDGTGTTSFAYHPFDGATSGAGRLAFVNGPLPNDTLAYTYDDLGRTRRLEIVDDATRSVRSFLEEYSFDERGRILSLTDNLGTFSYGYAGQSDRLASVDHPNGARAEYAYFPTSGDQLLRQIKNLSAGTTRSVLSQFDYTYTPGRSIDTWSVAKGSTQQSWEFDYDDAERLARAELLSATQTPISAHNYAYDGAGNRVHVSDATGPHNYTVDSRNRLVSERGFGPTPFVGTVDEPARVTINGQPARVTSTGGAAPYRFEGWVDLVQGANSVAIQAVDGRGNTATQQYSLNAGGTTTNYEYDADGNLRFEREPGGAVRREYRWDQENRLIAVIQGTRESRFAYDSESRRSRVQEFEGAVEVSNRTFVWCEDRVCQERNATGNAIERSFFTHGVQQSGGNYVYARDHLGSVHELVAADGTTIAAEYSYDPWGVSTRTGGTGPDSPERFTGLHQHAPSGDLLTQFRAYDPRLGRWLSRDPIDEAGGLNLYSYVDGNPVSRVDPTGETPWGLIFAGIDLGMQLYNNGGNIRCVNWGQVGLSMVGGGLLGALGKGAFRFKTFGSHTWGATRSWMNSRGIQMIRAGQQRHHWLFERNQGIGRYIPDAIKNQPWNTNPISAPFNNWLGRHPSLAWMGGPAWAGEILGGAGLTIGGSDECDCNQ